MLRKARYVAAEPRRSLLGVLSFFFVCVVFLLSAAPPAVAQSTRPTTAAVESQPVARTRPISPDAENGGVNWTKLAMSMFIVLGLIVALRYVAVWFLPGARVGGGGRGVRVLGRTAIAPRQQILLLHVGRRVLVVGDSAGTMSPLANIDEPDEVAELLGQMSQTTPTNAASRFKALFGRAERDFETHPESLTEADDLEAGAADPNAEPATADPNIAAAQNEISGLLDRMRSLSKSVKR